MEILNHNLKAKLYSRKKSSAPHKLSDLVICLPSLSLSFLICAMGLMMMMMIHAYLVGLS